VHPTTARDEALAALRGMGERVTAPRAAVIEVLAGTVEHLSAEEVAESARGRGHDLHLATAYRALKTLSGLGLVRHTHLPGGSTTYHLATSGGPRAHAHAACTSCGKVVDVPEEWLDDLVQRMRSEQGFELAPHHAALTGRCADCRPA